MEEVEIRTRLFGEGGREEKEGGQEGRFKRNFAKNGGRRELAFSVCVVCKWFLQAKEGDSPRG